MTTTRYDRMRAAADELKLQAMKAPGASVERVTCLTLHDQLHADADELEREIEALRRDAARYRELSTPEITDFLAAVEREALHQRDRWGVDHDAGKADSDWFWLIGFLAGKALHKPEKMLHHIITTAAACLNWHAARVGAHTAMRPGIAGEGAVMAPKPNHDAALAANGEKGT